MAIARNSETVRRQALKALRLMTLGLLPIVPLAIALAGSLIPRLLGPEWSGAIVPFQILVVAGAGHGITNVLGSVFAGVGGETLIRRSRIDLVWAGGTLATIALGVHIAGIRGAAAAHLLTFSCLTVAYLWCARKMEYPHRRRTRASWDRGIRARASYCHSREFHGCRGLGGQLSHSQPMWRWVGRAVFRASLEHITTGHSCRVRRLDRNRSGDKIACPGSALARRETFRGRVLAP